MALVNENGALALDATLLSILAELNGDIETLLNSIVTNTGAIKVDADTINVNTDTLEALLTGLQTRWDAGVFGLYTAAPGALSDGTAAKLLLDSTRNLKVNLATLLYGEDATNNLVAVHAKPHGASGYSSSLYQSLAAVTKANVKATPGNVYAVRITNENAAARYFQLHNKTTAPAAGDTPQMVLKVPAGTAAVPGVLTLDRSFFAEVENFSLGIGWAISTTLTTFTDAATASEHLATIRYV